MPVLQTPTNDEEDTQSMEVNGHPRIYSTKILHALLYSYQHLDIYLYTCTYLLSVLLEMSRSPWPAE